MPTQPAPPEYVLGRSEKESQRLVKQSVFMRPSTEHVFRKAGIADGMRVLDIGLRCRRCQLSGCGAGRPTGTVVGIDRDPGVLELARSEPKRAGLTNVTFEESELDPFTATHTFDAVVGRFVLMYQADPSRRLRICLEPSGTKDSLFSKNRTSASGFQPGRRWPSGSR